MEPEELEGQVLTTTSGTKVKLGKRKMIYLKCFEREKMPEVQETI